MATALPDECTYWITDGEQCGRRPIEADYFERDPLRGERHVASLCGRHHTHTSHAYALAHDYSWTLRAERQAQLRAIPGGVPA